MDLNHITITSIKGKWQISCRILTTFIRGVVSAKVTTEEINAFRKSYEITYALSRCLIYINIEVFQNARVQHRVLACMVGKMNKLAK